jgi:hypothetical protein
MVLFVWDALTAGAGVAMVVAAWPLARAINARIGMGVLVMQATLSCVPLAAYPLRPGLWLNLWMGFSSLGLGCWYAMRNRRRGHPAE